MPDEYDDGPEFVVGENAFGTGHSRWLNTVVEDGFQLAVCVALNFRGRERRNWRRDVLDERYPAILSIIAMASNAVVGERLLAIGQGFGVRWQRILLVFVADKDVVLRECHCSRFKLPWRFRFAACEHEKSDRQDRRGEAAHVSPPHGR